MNQSIQLPNNKVTVSRLGMRIIDPLTPEEWQELAAGIGEMASSIAFTFDRSHSPTKLKVTCRVSKITTDEIETSVDDPNQAKLPL